MNTTRDTEDRATRYIDARISLTWLITAVVTIVASYATLLVQMQQLKEAISELKQDRVTWVAQNDRVLSELRSISASDAVQTNRIETLEREVRVLGSRVRVP